MSKAYTVGAKKRLKRRQSEADASLPAREPSGRRQRAGKSETERATMDTALRAVCRRMGWPCDEAHMAAARDQGLSTLYGRLYARGLISEEARDGIREYEALDRSYRRAVLGADLPGAGLPNGGEIDPERARMIADEWARAQGAIESAGYSARMAIPMVLESSPDSPVTGVSPAVCAAADRGGRALNEHFSGRR